MSVPTEGLNPKTELKATMPTIAMIGMEGAGKTVLATTFAKRLSTIDASGVFLNPQGVRTLKYVEDIWATLQSGEWPPSTPPGEKFELNWKFHLVGEFDVDLRLVDVAGQDLRLLFGEERIDDQSLPGHLQSVADYCRSVDIILFLVNLGDFLGEGDPARRTANEAAIKSAMDYLTGDTRPRRVCLLLTQADLYKELARQHGGWIPLVQYALPYIFGAHVAVKNTVIHPLAAVADTTVAIDERGIPRHVPVAGFRSAGFNPLVAWLTKQVREIKQELEMQRQATYDTIPPDKKKRNWTDYATAYFWIVVLLLPLISGFCSSYSRKLRPSPVFVSKHYRDNPGLVDSTVTAYGFVRNDGGAGNIVVVAWVTENGAEVDRRQYNLFLNSGEVAPFEIDLPKIYSVKNPHEVQVELSVP